MIYLKHITISVFFIFFSFDLNSTNIAVVNIEDLINSNDSYKAVIKNIEKNQSKYLNKLKKKELLLEKKLLDIENDKLILSEQEINNKVLEYNKDLSNFRILIDDFNNHYKIEISNIRKKFLEEIILLLEIYAKNNNIELIIDATNYLIASNSLNITEVINKELLKVKINLEFNEFDENKL